MKDDTISRQAAIDAIKNSKFLLNAMKKVIKLPSAQPEPRWIPCSERLPEKGFTVLVTRLTNDNITYIELASLQDDCWMSNCDEYDKPTDHKVIAWMPLPEPYKGGREE